MSDDGFRAADVAKRRIVEDDIGRHALLLGPVAPPLAQRLEQRVVRKVGAASCATFANAFGGTAITSFCSPLRIGLAPGPKLRPPNSSARSASRASSERETGRTSASSSASMMPNTESSWWPNWRTFSLSSPPEHRRQMGDAEPHFGAEGGAQQFCGNRRSRRSSPAARGNCRNCRRSRAGPRRSGEAGSRGGRSRLRRRRRARSAARAPAAAAAGSTSVSIRRRARAKSSAPQNSQASAGSPSRPARPVS